MVIKNQHKKLNNNCISLFNFQGRDGFSCNNTRNLLFEDFRRIVRRKYLLNIDLKIISYLSIKNLKNIFKKLKMDNKQNILSENRENEVLSRGEVLSILTNQITLINEKIVEGKPDEEIDPDIQIKWVKALSDLVGKFRLIKKDKDLDDMEQQIEVLDNVLEIKTLSSSSDKNDKKKNKK